MSKHKHFLQRVFLLRNERIVQNLMALLPQLPLDEEKPLEVIIREEKPHRRQTLNAAMWAGPLADIERDGWYGGRQYRAEVWHEHFKELFLPDPADPEFDTAEVVDGYQKWEVDPWSDRRVLVGTTTQLTDRGMRLYLQKMEAHAAQEYGVTFTERNC